MERKSNKIGMGLAVIVVALVILEVVLISNLHTGEMISTEGKESVKVGVLIPLSGVRAEGGQYVIEGLELALEDINKDRSRKYNLELIYEDTQYIPKEAASGFYKLKDMNGVKFIIGSIGSSSTLAVAPLAEGAKIVLVSPASQSNSISDVGDYIFRTQTNTRQEAPFFAQYIAPIIGDEPIHIIGINTDYTPSFLDAYTPELERLGGKIGVIEKYDIQNPDFRSILTKISTENPKYIFALTTGKHVALMIKQSYEMGMDVQWFAPSPVEGAEFLETIGELGEGVIYPYAYDGSSDQKEMKEYREKYIEKYEKKNEMISANSYDALYLLSNCFEEVGLNTTKVKDCLYTVEDYNGASGTFSIDENGDVVKDFVIKTVRNGEFVLYE